jgi:DNA-binding CsgD family transcriptional regulator
MTIIRPTPLSPLGEREREALIMYGQGMDYSEIAAAMTVSPHTIKNHLDNCRQKLGVKTSREAYFKLMRMERRGA